MDDYKFLYMHYLDQLKEEISLYKNEEDIWKLSGKISNTPGNLCLHLCGNLNHFFGATLGNTGYVRDRDLEFSRKNVSREELISGIEKTKVMLEKVLDNIKLENFGDTYPLETIGKKTTVGFEVSRLLSHLAYHVAQINYHRRILDL